MTDYLPYIGAVIGLVGGIFGAATSVFTILRQQKLDRADIASKYQSMLSEGLTQINGLLVRIAVLEADLTGEKVQRRVDYKQWYIERDVEQKMWEAERQAWSVERKSLTKRIEYLESVIRANEEKVAP